MVAVQTVLQLGTTPIGGPLLGFIADIAGARLPILIGGVAALVTFVFGYIAGRRRLNVNPVAAQREDTGQA